MHCVLPAVKPDDETDYKKSEDLFTLLNGELPAHLQSLERQLQMKAAIKEQVVLHVAPTGPQPARAPACRAC